MHASSAALVKLLGDIFSAMPLLCVSIMQLLNALRALSIGSAFIAAMLSIVAATKVNIFVTPSYISIDGSVNLAQIGYHILGPAINALTPLQVS
jgi:hypothetical protein